MNTPRDGDDYSSYARKLQSVIITKLVVAMANTHHVDELLYRLASAIAQYCGTQVVEFWVNQTNETGQTTVQLRTLVCKDTSLPEHVVVNEHIARMAYHVIGTRSSSLVQPVEMVLPAFQASMLKRYGLRYCINYFLSRNVLIPPPNNVSPQQSPPGLLAMTGCLFFQDSPHRGLTATMNAILEQALTVAEKHSLLLPATADNIGMASTPRQETTNMLEKLIPRHTQDDRLLLSDSPFASSSALPGKKAGRLYSAIDGRKNIAALCAVTGMKTEEAYATLRTLLTRQLIEIHTPEGQRVDASRLFKQH